MTDPARLQLSLAGRPADLAVARAFVAHVARAAGVVEVLVEDLRLATSEALATLIESAFGSLTINASVDGQRLSVSIPANQFSRHLFASRLLIDKLGIEVGGDDGAFQFVAPVE